jgi:hypothetical protein
MTNQQPPKPWSDEDKRLVVRLRDAGREWPEIAEAAGRPKNRCASMFQTLKKEGKLNDYRDVPREKERVASAEAGWGRGRKKSKDWGHSGAPVAEDGPAQPIRTYFDPTVGHEVKVYPPATAKGSIRSQERF